MRTNLLCKTVIALAACLTTPVTPVLAEPGDLDPSFGTGGTTRMQLSQPASAQGMALQSDGKIVVAGYGKHSNVDFAVVRYNTDGSPDGSFGIGGKLTTPIRDEEDYGAAVAIQGDGKILVAGYYDSGYWWQPAVVRYLPNGSLDTSFGEGYGKWTGWGLSRVSSVAVQSDGKILVAGWDETGDGLKSWFMLARLNPDGSMDETFGINGHTRADFGDPSNRCLANAMAVQGDGKIVLAGWIEIGGLEEFALARFLPGGQLDPTFGFGGQVIAKIGPYDNGANSVVVQSDGKILVGGYSDVGSGPDFTLIRLTQSGMLDFAFGTNGIVTADFGGYQDACTSLAIQGNGMIVAAGIAYGSEFMLLRYTDWGLLDTNFGNMGKVRTDYTGAANSVAVQSDGKILVAGGG